MCQDVSPGTGRDGCPRDKYFTVGCLWLWELAGHRGFDFDQPLVRVAARLVLFGFAFSLEAFSPFMGLLVRADRWTVAGC